MPMEQFLIMQTLTQCCQPQGQAQTPISGSEPIQDVREKVKIDTLFNPFTGFQINAYDTINTVGVTLIPEVGLRTLANGLRNFDLQGVKDELNHG